MKFIIIILIFLISSCTTVNNIERDVNYIERDIKEFNINPQVGLNSGSRTTINNENKVDILKTIKFEEDKKKLIKNIWLYITESYRKGEITNGAYVRDINEIIESKEIKHCGESGAMLVGLFRLYGIPCIYIQGLNIRGANDLNLNHWSGHVFIEIYINNEYYLIDSTRGIAFKNYDLSNRIIPIKIENFADNGFVEMFRCFDVGNLIESQESYSNYLSETRNYYIKFGKTPKEYLYGEKIMTDW
jgi:hypothetical protein